MQSAPAIARATLRDLEAIPEDVRDHEVLDGELVRRAAPSVDHGIGHARLITWLGERFDRRPQDDGRGGWWFFPETEVLFASGDVARPDVHGLRRSSAPVRPTGFPQRHRPDWVAEIVSPSQPSVDTVKKTRIYHQAGIPYYWLLDPRDASLRVLRWSEAGYVQVLGAERGETIRAEPFEACDLVVGYLFGDDVE